MLQKRDEIKLEHRPWMPSVDSPVHYGEFISMCVPPDWGVCATRLAAIDRLWQSHWTIRRSYTEAVESTE